MLSSKANTVTWKGSLNKREAGGRGKETCRGCSASSVELRESSPKPYPMLTTEAQRNQDTSYSSRVTQQMDQLRLVVSPPPELALTGSMCTGCRALGSGLVSLTKP